MAFALGVVLALVVVSAHVVPLFEVALSVNWWQVFLPGREDDLFQGNSWLTVHEHHESLFLEKDASAAATSGKLLLKALGDLLLEVIDDPSGVDALL